MTMTSTQISKNRKRIETMNTLAFVAAAAAVIMTIELVSAGTTADAHAADVATIAIVALLSLAAGFKLVAWKLNKMVSVSVVENIKAFSAELDRKLAAR